MDNILDNWNVDAGARFSTIGVHQDFKLVSTSRFNQIVNAADPIVARMADAGGEMPFENVGVQVFPLAAAQGFNEVREVVLVVWE